MHSTFALYLHFPFCARKCPYCAFASGEVSQAGEMREVLQGMVAEARERAKMSPWRDLQVHSLFFGGGTPSLAPGSDLRRLVHSLRELFSFTPNAECTIEVNPGTFTPDKIEDWREAGMNRISLGVQSLDDRVLRFLGRLHSASEAREAFSALKKADFPLLNVDLIYGANVSNALPAWSETLGEILEWEPDHISAYGLTIEEGTPFAQMQQAGKRLKVDEETELAQYESACDLFEQSGYEHYEVSNWAKPTKRSRHNLSYWDGHPYLPLGPASHGFDGYYRRFWNHRETKRWLKAVEETGIGEENHEELDLSQRFDEQVVLGLRMVAGVEEERLLSAAKQVGKHRFPIILATLIDEGYLVRQGNRLCYTRKGLVVADALEIRLTMY